MALDFNQQQRRHYLGGIVFGAFLGVGFAIATWAWVFGDVYPARAEQVESVTKQVQKYQRLEKKGIETFTQLNEIAGADLPQYVSQKQQEASGYLTAISNGTGTFLARLKTANAEAAAQADVVSKQLDMVGNIVPTFSSDVSDESFENGVSNKVNLRRLVQYMEDQMIRRFGFQTLFPVGIEGIRFEPVDREIYKIGSFTVSFPFKAPLSTVNDFLKFLNETGKLPLTPGGQIDVSAAPAAGRGRTASVAAASFSPMSNLLITVEQLTVDAGFLAPSRSLGDPASGTVTLRFYVRTLGFDEMRLLVQAVGNRIRGSKEDPSGGLRSRMEAYAKDVDAKVAKACEGSARNTEKCPLTDVDFVHYQDQLKSLTSTVGKIDGAYSDLAAQSVTRDRDDVKLSGALSDIWRRLGSIEQAFVDTQSALKVKLGRL